MNAEKNNNKNLQFAVSFFMVADMETSLRYYTKNLGFTINL